MQKLLDTIFPLGIALIRTSVYFDYFSWSNRIQVALKRITMSDGTKDHKHIGPRLEDLMVVVKVDAVIDRLSSHKNVEGVIICDKDGAAIQTTMDNTNTVMYAEGIRNAAVMATSMIRDVDPTNSLMYIRIGTKKLEMMAHLDPDYLAIVIQSRVKNSKKED